MKDVLARELRKANPDMGTISAALWWGRYVASCPNEYGALHFAGAWGHRINVDEATPDEARAILEQMRLEGPTCSRRPGSGWPTASNKVQKALEIVEQVKAAGEKAIVFTKPARALPTLEAVFSDRCIAYVAWTAWSPASATTSSAASKPATPPSCSLGRVR